ncbi:MAG: DUF3060 domain-containing protein [Deltaproteobacteria bacterium]|nr:DUF3060 domain-containing protein [Deltaproteobacteria bacterium]
MKTHRCAISGAVLLFPWLVCNNAPAADSVTITKPGGITVKRGDGSAITVKPPAGKTDAAPENESNRRDLQASGKRVVVGPEGNRKLTVSCRGMDVDVQSSANHVTLQGTCGVVNISGPSNVVVVESTSEIIVSGPGNHVTWLKAFNGQPPRLSDTGAGNVVVQSNAQAGKPGAPAGGETKAAPSNDPSQRIVVLQNRDKRTVECRGKDVDILGNDNALTFRGACGQVNVQGNRNTVALEAARSIAVVGNNNRLDWQEGVGGGQPSVSNLGNGNVIAEAAR